MSNQSVQFEKDLVSEHHQLFLRVRKILLSFVEITEIKKSRITTYATENGGVCHMRTTKDGVDIGYLKGAQIKDKYELLGGKTKKMRVQKVPAHKPLNEAAIRYYVQESMNLIA